MAIKIDINGLSKGLSISPILLQDMKARLPKVSTSEQLYETLINENIIDNDDKKYLYQKEAEQNSQIAKSMPQPYRVAKVKSLRKNSQDSHTKACIDAYTLRVKVIIDQISLTEGNVLKADDYIPLELVREEGGAYKECDRRHDITEACHGYAWQYLCFIPSLKGGFPKLSPIPPSRYSYSWENLCLGGEIVRIHNCVWYEEVENNLQKYKSWLWRKPHSRLEDGVHAKSFGYGRFTNLANEPYKIVLCGEDLIAMYYFHAFEKAERRKSNYYIRMLGYSSLIVFKMLDDMSTAICGHFTKEKIVFIVAWRFPAVPGKTP